MRIIILSLLWAVMPALAQAQSPSAEDADPAPITREKNIYDFDVEPAPKGGSKLEAENQALRALAEHVASLLRGEEVVMIYPEMQRLDGMRTYFDYKDFQDQIRKIERTFGSHRKVFLGTLSLSATLIYFFGSDFFQSLSPADSVVYKAGIAVPVALVFSKIVSIRETVDYKARFFKYLATELKGSQLKVPKYGCDYWLRSSLEERYRRGSYTAIVPSNGG